MARRTNLRAVDALDEDKVSTTLPSVEEFPKLRSNTRALRMMRQIAALYEQEKEKQADLTAVQEEKKDLCRQLNTILKARTPEDVKTIQFEGMQYQKRKGKAGGGVDHKMLKAALQKKGVKSSVIEACYKKATKPGTEWESVVVVPVVQKEKEE